LAYYIMSPFPPLQVKVGVFLFLHHHEDCHTTPQVILTTTFPPSCVGVPPPFLITPCYPQGIGSVVPPVFLFSPSPTSLTFGIASFLFFFFFPLCLSQSLFFFQGFNFSPQFLSPPVWSRLGLAPPLCVEKPSPLKTLTAVRSLMGFCFRLSFLQPSFWVPFLSSRVLSHPLSPGSLFHLGRVFPPALFITSLSLQ